MALKIESLASVNRFLIDTHALIWAVHHPDMLSPKVRDLLGRIRVAASVASLWELVIKRRKSITYPVKEPIVWWERHVVSKGIETIPIRLPHIAHLDRLPFWERHRDPFDRLLIQALTENLLIISKDQNFAAYKDLKVIW